MSLKNNFKRVHFSVKFQVMCGDGEIMAGRGSLRQNYRWLWVMVAKLCLGMAGSGR